MAIRALLFDKDGTLVDIQSTLGPATCDVLAHFAAGDEGLFHRLADLTRVDAAARRLLPGCPVISEATDAYGRLWAEVLGRPFTPALCAEIDRLYL
jgi:phosphoglycolate phosphatase